MRKIVLLLGLFIYSSAYSQLLEDAFSDGNYTSNLVWFGNDNTHWLVSPDAQGGVLTLGSNTLRLNDNVSGVSYLSTLNSSWGSFQAWGLWWGRQGALDEFNSQYFWLFSDKADVTDPTVNGYRLALKAGPISGDPEVIQLQKVLNGVPDGNSIIEINFPTVLLDPGDPSSVVPMTDFGFSLRITRSAANEWAIITNYDIANLVPGDGQPATTSGFGATAFAYTATEVSPYIPITGTGYMSIETRSNKAIIDGNSGGPEFDEIQFQANGTLPVTLESLKAVKDGSSKARLDWKVGIEDNVKGYEIERSPNGISFSKIGFVPAIGSRNYNFTDQQILPARNFYRLKTVDNDGTYKYSFIVSINGATSESSLKVFPNPVKNNLFVQHADAGAQARLRIFGMDGRLVQFIRVPENAVQTNINVTSLKPGIYNLIYEDVTGERQVSKFIKQ